MVFASREVAGRRLGTFLQERGVAADLVLGLPRGGVIVAAGVAEELHAALDVLVVRKIGHPSFREFAVGALAENGVVVLDESLVGRIGVDRGELDAVVDEEMERLASYEARFHHGPPPGISGKSVLLVDDGLATGATTEAAVQSARSRGASPVTVAAPVASVGAMRRLERVADSVLVIRVDPDFDAVGRYYESFPQTTDEEVLDILRRHQPHRRAA